MSKKSWKDLIFINENKEAPKEEKFTSKFDAATTFPSKAGTTVAPIASATVIPTHCAPHMDDVMKKYEEGFARLNKPGIEFFEFFQAVLEAGMDKGDAYKMALKMLSTMEKSMTKDSLIAQSQYYIEELLKVHASFNDAGNKMKNQVLTEKNTEGTKLSSDIQLLKEQLESIKSEISRKEQLLAEIDDRYGSKLNDLDCKIMANDEAKNRISGSINGVVNGIKQNL